MFQHTVRKGETLDAIARQYSLPSGKWIYSAACNSSLRTIRPSANSIKVNDKIYIPDNPVKAAQTKYDALVKLREDYLKMNEDIRNGWRNEQRRFTSVNEKVDVGLAVADIFGSLFGIVKKGMTAMKLSGALAEKANKALGKEVLGFAYKPLVEKAADIFSEVKADDDTKSLYLKAIVQSALNFKSPTFWAAQLTGTNASQVNEDVLFNIENEKNKVLADLNRKIAAADADLIAQKAIYFRGGPLY
ncbi:MAG: LysM peptidoglycan-binding domain-containing protein [Gemmatimonadaceae bacterium]|nr:LysM peptidoglycan-binding domain-containing protein [Chitinophagaceae bacterium]